MERSSRSRSSSSSSRSRSRSSSSDSEIKRKLAAFETASLNVAQKKYHDAEYVEKVNKRLSPEDVISEEERIAAMHKASLEVHGHLFRKDPQHAIKAINRLLPLPLRFFGTVEEFKKIFSNEYSR